MQCDLATLLYSYFGYVELVQALEADSSFPPPPLYTCRYMYMYVLLRYVASFPLPAAVLPHSVFPYSLPSPVSGSSSGPGLSGYIGADKLNQVYTWEYLALGDSLAAQAGTATSRCRDARTEEGMKARALLVRRCRLLAFSFCHYLHVPTCILADGLFPSGAFFLFSHWRGDMPVVL